MATYECAIHDSTRGQSRRGNLTRAVEQREVIRRAQEASRGELQKVYSGQATLQHIDKNVVVDDLKRRDRESKERNSEAQMLDSLYQRNPESSPLSADEEDKFATVLARRTLEKDRKDKEIQQLREQSSELRELAEKIRVAKVNKERSQQLQEQAKAKIQTAQYDQAFNTYIDQVDAAAEARAVEFETRRREQNILARRVLEEQMLEKQDALRQADDEFHRERAMVDEVVRRINEEDVAEETLRRQRQEETKSFIRNFLEEKEINKVAKIQALQMEDRKIQQHWNTVREREALEAGWLADKKDVADRMYEKAKREMEDGNRKREEEEDLINLLRQEELEVKRRAEDEERRLKADAMRAEIKHANEQQKWLREQRDAHMHAEEEEFRRKLMAKFAEDDRVEQINAQKRRMKLVEHQRAVQAMIDDKRRLYMEQKVRDEADLAAQRAEDERKLGIMEEERRRLLAEAAELREFLPRGVIRDQGDLDYMNQILAMQHIVQ